MATWSEFALASPDLAQRGRALLYQYGPPLGYLATVRADGGPRIHPFCPVVTEGGLWAYVLRTSPKGADLRRDPRYALHASLRWTSTTSSSSAAMPSPARPTRN